MAWETLWYLTGAETGGTHEAYSLSGTVSTSTSQRSHALGSRSYQLSSASEIQFEVGTVYPTGSQTGHAQAWFRCTSTSGPAFYWSMGNTASPNVVRLQFNADDDSIDLYDSAGLDTSSSTGVWPSDGTWFKVLWVYTYSATGGNCRVYIDGTQVINSITWTHTTQGIHRFATASSNTVYVDDLIIGIETTGALTNDCGDLHVVGYRSSKASATADFGGHVLAGGNWNDAQEFPFSATNEITLSSTGGSANYAGVITDDLGGADNSGGPPGDSYILKPYSLVSHKYIWYARRTNGGTPTSYGINGGAHDGSLVYYHGYNLSGDSLTTSNAGYSTVIASDNAGAPSTSRYGAIGGYHTADGGRDIIISDMLYMTVLEYSLPTPTLTPVNPVIRGYQHMLVR